MSGPSRDTIGKFAQNSLKLFACSVLDFPHSLVIVSQDLCCEQTFQTRVLDEFIARLVWTV